ncbi:MAG: helix-turn-helix transcriptional regulator [Actinomycetota bacterium]
MTTTVGVDYQPFAHPVLPVEVFDRTSLLDRIDRTELASRQLLTFHVLVLGTRGEGVHHVDFEPVRVGVGTLMHIHPGQVQQFRVGDDHDAVMVAWPAEHDHPDPELPLWYPGSDAQTVWQLDDESFDWCRRAIEDLRDEQERFDGSPRRAELLISQLATLLLRIALLSPGPTRPSALPPAYLAFRQALEQRVYARPTVRSIATEIGYSSRTLDRACVDATGRTAKQVADTRVALEIRRLLTHTSRPIAAIGTDFGFTDPSNFSKFVRRHLGALPGAIRRDEA